VPTAATGAVFQKHVTNMNVVSNVEGVGARGASEEPRTEVYSHTEASGKQS
jgi:hypothetical protein